MGARKESQRIKELKHSLGLTNTSIAKKIGCSTATVSNWCVGKYSPNKTQLHKLAEILNISVEDANSIFGVTTPRVRETKQESNNFWQKTRQDANLTMKDVTELINLDRKALNLPELAKTTVSKYFTGQVLPSDRTVQSLCNIFNVDLTLGKNEMRTAYIEWHREAKATPKVAEPETTEETSENIEVTSQCEQAWNRWVEKGVAEPETTSDATTSTTPNPVETVVRNLYGKIPYDDFKIVENAAVSSYTTRMLCEAIYGNVSYAAFNRAWSLSSGEVEF